MGGFLVGWNAAGERAGSRQDSRCLLPRSEASADPSYSRIIRNCNLWIL